MGDPCPQLASAAAACTSLWCLLPVQLPSTDLPLSPASCCCCLHPTLVLARCAALPSRLQPLHSSPSSPALPRSVSTTSSGSSTRALPGRLSMGSSSSKVGHWSWKGGGHKAGQRWGWKAADHKAGRWSWKGAVQKAATHTRGKVRGDKPLDALDSALWTKEDFIGRSAFQFACHILPS